MSKLNVQACKIRSKPPNKSEACYLHNVTHNAKSLWLVVHTHRAQRASIQRTKRTKSPLRVTTKRQIKSPKATEKKEANQRTPETS